LKNKVILIFVFFFCSNVHSQFMNWKELSAKYLDQLEVSTSGEIYAVSRFYDKVYKSTDDGTSWSPLTSISYPNFISVKGKDTVFVGSGYGLYISTDAGITFNYITFFYSAIRCIKSKDFGGVNYIFVGTDSSGLSVSTDFGLTWQTKLSEIKYFEKITFSGNNILAKTMNNGLYISQDFGLTWNKKVVNSSMPWIYDVETIDGSGTAFVSAGGIYKSTNSGIDWTYLANISADCIAYSPLDNQLFAGKYLSDDMGVTWRVVCWFVPDWITIKDSTTFLLNENGSLYREDHAPIFIYKGNNFFPMAVGNKWQYIKSSSDNDYFTSYSLCTTEVLSDTIINGKHFFLVNDDSKYDFLYYSDDNKLLLNGHTLLMDFNLLGHEGFEFYGATWATVYEGPVTLFGYERYYKGLSSNYYGIPFSRKYADSIGVYYYYSNENGPMGSNFQERLDLIEASVKIQDSTYLYKVNYIPTVNSNTVILISDTLLGLSVMVSHPRDMISDTPKKSLFFTNSAEVEYFFTKGTDSIAGGRKQLNRLENSNSFYDSISFSNLLYNQGYEIKYRFHLTDKGIIPSSSTYPGNGYLSYKIDPVSVTKEDIKILNFQLFQNYPNPFNPSTRIQYSVASGQNVTLKVFDVLGNEVATLVNELKVPGVYTVQFDGGDLTSGVYFYKLQSGSFVQTKKFVLMK